ncbi:hypothetical protein SAMN05421493_12015 [Pseudobutyrivibrio sp. 49]|uniref:hypothetical protein n=1 Tax=Pseudobutyrivibrio sp. 49 TaxID=1855344 RepID=UPI000881B480|nr:hypothetical protein [Pseudobutyrivibrio sp. 49]SDI61861.1 hypothetical protein SAMN05421493_12015 [Pseudobutyrivibrio sp. 49]
MMSQKMLATMGVVGGVFVLVWAIWMIYVGVKYKANQNEEIKVLLTKAKAASSHVLWYMIIVWGLVASFIGEKTTITISQIRLFIILLLGIQCIIEVLAFFYYKDEMKKKAELEAE